METVGNTGLSVMEAIDRLQKETKAYKFRSAIAREIGVTDQYISQAYKGVDKASQKLTDGLERLLKEEGIIKAEALPKVKQDTEHKIPYYDITATAGDVDVFTDTQYATDYITMPQFNDCDIALNVWGDSMEPEYKSGTIIFCKRIEDFAVIDFGHAHLIVTSEQNLLKILQPDEKDDSIWILESLNSKYRPFRIPKDKVTNLFKVKGKANQTAM